MKHKNKLKCPFNSDEAYVESLNGEIKSLKQDVVDLIKCTTNVVRCGCCERFHNGMYCPYCDNSVRPEQRKKQ